MNSYMSMGMLVLLVVVMYFLLIRPQKKKEKQVNAMRSALRVGDEIVTIGGICGKIVKTKEESIVIQVGADKLKFEMMRWSVSKVLKPSDRPEEPSEEKEDGEEQPKKTLPKRMKKAVSKEEAPQEDASVDEVETKDGKEDAASESEEK